MTTCLQEAASVSPRRYMSLSEGGPHGCAARPADSTPACLQDIASAPAGDMSGADSREPATFKRWAPSTGASSSGATSSSRAVDKQGSGQQEGLMQRVMQQAVYVEQQVVANAKQLVDKILYEEVPVVS